MAASGEAVVVCCSAIFLVLLSFTTLHVTAAPLSDTNGVLNDNIKVTNSQTDEGSNDYPSGTKSKHSFQHETDIIKRTQRQYLQNLAKNSGNSREKRDLSGDLKHVAPQKAPERKFQREYEENSRRLHDWEARQYPGQRDYYRNKLGSRGQYVDQGPNLPPRGGYPGRNAYQEPRENTQDIIPPQRWEDPEKVQAGLDSNNFMHGKVELPPADVKPLVESAPRMREGAKIYTPERVGVPRQVAGFWDDTPDGSPDKTDTERSLLETLAKADRQKFHRIGFGPQKVSTQYDVGKGRVQQEYGRRQGERYPAQQQERYPGPYDRPAYGNNRDNRPPSRYQQDRREHFRAPMEPANLQGSFHSPFSNFEKKEENTPLNGMNFVLPHEIQDVVPKPHRPAAAISAAAVTTPKEEPVTDPPTYSDQEDSEASEGETNQEDKWDVPMPPKSKAWLAEHPEEQEVRGKVQQPVKTTHSQSTVAPTTTKPPIPMPPKSKKWLEEQRLKKEMEELAEEKAELGRLEEEARGVEGNEEGQPGTDRDDPSAEGGLSEQGLNTVEKPSNRTNPSVSKADRQAELERENEEMFEEFEHQEKSRNDTKPSSEADRQAELERENEEMLKESKQEEEDQWPTETENGANRQPVYEDPRHSMGETNFMVNQTSPQMADTQRGSNQAASPDQYVDDDDGEIEGEEVNDRESDTSQREVDMNNPSSVQDFDNIQYERQREENRSSIAQQPEQVNRENREEEKSKKQGETKAGLDDFAKMWAEANKGRRRRKRGISEGQIGHGAAQEKGTAGKRAEGAGVKGAGNEGVRSEGVGKEGAELEGAGKKGAGKDPSVGGGGVGAQGVAPTNDILVDGKKIPMPARRGNAVLKPAEKVVASPMREIQPERLGVPKKAAGFWEDTPQGDDGKGGEVSKGQGHMKVTLNKGRPGQKVESSRSRPSSSRSRSPSSRSRSSSSRRVVEAGQRGRVGSSSVVKPSPFDSVGGRSPFDKTEMEDHKKAPVVPQRDAPGVPPPPQPKDKPEDQKQVSNRQITSVNQELEEVKVPLERPKSVLHNAPVSAPKKLEKARPASQDQERRVEVERRHPEIAPDVPGLRDNPVRSAYRTRTGEVRGLKEHQAPSQYKTELSDDVTGVKETPVYKAFSGVKSQVEFSGRKSQVEVPVPSSHRVTEAGPVNHDDANTSEPAGNDTEVSYQIFNTGFYATIMKRYKSKDAFWGALCLATLLFITFSAVWYSKMWRKRDGDWDFASTYKPPISIPIRELLRQKLGKISHLKVKLKRKKKGPASRTGRAGHRYLQLTRKQTSANTPTSSEEEVTYKRL